MGIEYFKKSNIFHLFAADYSYVIKIMEHGELAHVYWGKKIERSEDIDCKKLGKAAGLNPLYRDGFSLDCLPQEYSSNQSTDFREPAYIIRSNSGSTMSSLKYKSHQIYEGKPGLEGLPATYADDQSQAETLLIILTDEVIGLDVILSYTVFEESNSIARSARFINNSSDCISILKALSVNVDFDQREFDILHLAGSWLRERNIVREFLTPGIKSIQSKRGSSSHQHNPFIAILDKNATEDSGDVYGFSFVYSGNFIAQAEVDQYANTRVQMGINPHDFHWILEPSCCFQTPEVVLAYSANGIGDMSRTYHKTYREHLCRGTHRDAERPILANSWEAKYFDYTSEDIFKFATSAKDLGIELLVMDDGWFGNRDFYVVNNEPTSALGDWYVNEKKIPEGISGLAARVEKEGVKFGLWVEPEMISENSDLYKEHPEWCVHVESRDMYPGRYQHVLDLSRNEVCDYVVQAISELLQDNKVSYVKWDMNRYLTNIGSKAFPAERQQEISHRYILGLYHILERLVSAFPDVLFESCAGGGGRFDPGMLYYMPQTWTSDNSDAMSRVGIQLATSIVYPSITMGCHVSEIPSHQTGRNTPLKFRGDVAMMGNFGYEIDFSKLSHEECQQIREQVEFYKQIRSIVQFGDMYRLYDIANKGIYGVQYVSSDLRDVVVFIYGLYARPNSREDRIRLKGLVPDKNYVLSGTSDKLSSDRLMNYGLDVSIDIIDWSSTVIRMRLEK